MSDTVNVFLTFDIEVWCGGWKDLDAKFPAAYARYIFGRSAAGDYALPKTLEILDRHGLKGVFFVEPLFAARFGVEHLARIFDLIRAAGHDIQLHLHAEWCDELRPLPFPGANRKRQHLHFYSLEEQTTLIRMGLDLFRQAGCSDVRAFRAGSFGANADTYRALAACGIHLDFSLNEACPFSGPDLRGKVDMLNPTQIGAVQCIPLTVFRDGFGQSRAAQIGACSAAEMAGLLKSAQRGGVGQVVMLSHNFEMLKPDLPDPDGIVVRRFEKLCKFLAARRDEFTVSTVAMLPTSDVPVRAGPVPSVGVSATLVRYGEQFARRLLA